ncbi:hypothetical protein K0M31_009944 [Melipona bicolor]|uniref:Uncharacterized protein n=1 Tax=Melipona bicolor TaxID=60889 RepID=A0AA40FMV1_9HYME|nr:hypothetical protein K0M31_009944 [Melipona bicolor]
MDERGNGNEERRARCWRCEGAPTTAPASCCWALLVETPGGRYPRRVGTVREERGLRFWRESPTAGPQLLDVSV